MTLREARFRKGLTQFDLRIRTGIHQSKISLIETGYLLPTEVERKNLAKALNLRVDNLEFRTIPTGE